LLISDTTQIFGATHSPASTFAPTGVSWVPVPTLSPASRSLRLGARLQASFNARRPLGPFFKKSENQSGSFDILWGMGLFAHSAA